MLKIVYKLLNLLNFQSNDTIGVQKLVHFCFDTAIYIERKLPSVTDPTEFLHSMVLIMRISSNIIALENSFGDYIIEQWFLSQNRSIAAFFNNFIDFFVVNSLSVDEIYWFIGNIIRCPMNETVTQFLEDDEFMVKLKMIAPVSI